MQLFQPERMVSLSFFTLRDDSMKACSYCHHRGRRKPCLARAHRFFSHRRELR